ncbi:probable inactive receptor kinase At5g53320 isoform X2 [Vigna radiata var. radiata]|uniref:Probable inactive receptor kinase At5g53320 isoform X2 n=1 Tax=Vigna radiata var. radiata TaxID=3916 RepID=A0A3Q0F5T8_VIGRR|nr:probable inactive receptor kinase At5g53320 isoform X2 [Vigna radiata var. radiata]
MAKMLCVLLMIGAMMFGVIAEPTEDKQALLDFLHNISHSHHLINWDKSSSVCKSWIGVTCNSEQSHVIALQLTRTGLSGRIPPNTLSRLSALQTVSLASNRITGSFPSDFSQLNNLIYLYLQFNKFSGPLPSDFSVWKNLSIVNLSNNSFNGSIPFSLSNLTHLSSLVLANNTLSGDIPDLTIPTLLELNFANNNLSGVVPESLERFPRDAFSGGGSGQQVKSQKGEASRKKEGSESRDKNRIVFFEGCTLAFDLEDLLRASAEVLGKGTFGTVYKAALEDVTTVAVKRLKDVVVGKREFEQQMEMVGRIRHDNVAALRAYYYSKEEKLMVYDYYEQGSVSSMLHGKREGSRVSLNWDSRLKIAIGVARGIAHIHAQQGGKLLHGNIKSSNIFLNPRGYGCLSDIGLATLINPATRTTGYRAPEATDTRKSVAASDVYSFGVLLLELLTGRFPLHAKGGEEVVHLVRWVNSVVREEWTAEVFDVELLRYPNIEEEMVEMLQIGMACVVRTPDQRPKIGDVVRMVEEIRRVNAENRSSTESRSEGSTPTPHSIEIPSTSFAY